MPSRILLIGSDDLLAACVSAAELAGNSESSIYRMQATNDRRAEEFVRLVTEKILRGQQDNGIQAKINSWLHVVDGGLNGKHWTCPANFQAEKVWYFLPTRRNFKDHDREAFNQFLAFLPQLAARELNMVITAYPGAGTAEDSCRWISESAVEEQCRRQNIGFRIFRTALIVGECPSLLYDHDLLHFLGVLYGLKQEIQKRVPEYFDFETLRCPAPPEAEINVIHADRAAELMTAVARNEETLNRSFDIASSTNTPFADICERMGQVYGLGLLVTEDEQELNAIDRVFFERTGVFQKHLESPPSFVWEEAYTAAGQDSNQASMDERAQMEAFEAIHKRQEEAYADRVRRVEAVLRQLRQKKITKNGFDLTYFIGGSEGIPIVIFNALGQGLNYWYPLVDRLMEKRRVVIWEPRGTLFPPPPFGLKEQVDDTEAILQEEGIGRCDLAGWCTGPKVAVEFYLRLPGAVRSMIFLNSQFKCAGTPRELVTAYEHNIEPLFRVLEKNPKMAGPVMNSLQTNLSGGAIELSGQQDSQKLAIEVLSLMNQDLKPFVLSPFQSEATTLNYASQVLDFWSYDTLAKAAQVEAPILMIAAERDRIAAPAMSREARNRFPRVTHVEVQGASHYCLYDRPEFVAGLIDDFLENFSSGVEAKA